MEPAIGEMNAYFLEIIRARQAEPGTDLISKLATVESDGERLEDEKILGVCGFLLVGGHITTTMMLGSAVLLLAVRPELLKRLRGDLGAVPRGG